MTAKVMSDDPNEWEEAVRFFRRALSVEISPPIQLVINSGVVPRFVEFLSKHERPVLQFECAWALTNISSGNSEHTQFVISTGAVQAFVGLLTSDDEDLREQVAWGLGNIAGDGPGCRDYVLSHDAIPHFLQLAAIISTESRITTARNVAWAVSNLCRGKPAPDFEIVSPLLGLLERLVNAADQETVTDACWALSYLSDGPNHKIDAVLQTGVMPRIVQLLGSSSPAQTPALRLVGNIITGDDKQTAAILNIPQTLPILMNLLSHSKRNIRKEACWALSNIAAGTTEQVQTLINAGAIAKVSTLLLALSSSESQSDVLKEAVWCVSNATSGGIGAQIMHLVECGSLRGLCKQLATSDAKTLSVALDGVDNILNKCPPEGISAALLAVREVETAIDDACLHTDGSVRLRAEAIKIKLALTTDQAAI